jgi:nickel/cobalt transporter (NicO) family protein
MGGAAGAPRPTSGASRWVAGLDRRLADLVGERVLSPLIGVLAVLLALVLGAAHAALPGHGKTIMAAYQAGKRGRARDAVAVGVVVTLTHTCGVLAAGLLLTSVAGVTGETVLGWLAVVSGAPVVVVGATMLLALRRRAHSHAHSHPHSHSHSHDHSRPGRWSIAGIGIAGGLVPSPSALVVLLGAIALGRTPFGVLLVLAYGLGMAATLTAAGLLLVGMQRRLTTRLTGLAARLSTLVPGATGSLVLLVGLGLLGRAAATM